MQDNPQLNAVREVIDSIVGPGKTTGDLHAVQRHLLAECGEKLGQTRQQLDELRSRYDSLAQAHTAAIDALKMTSNMLRRLAELNQFGIPGLSEFRVALSDLLDDLT